MKTCGEATAEAQKSGSLEVCDFGMRKKKLPKLHFHHTKQGVFASKQKMRCFHLLLLLNFSAATFSSSSTPQTLLYDASSTTTLTDDKSLLHTLHSYSNPPAFVDLKQEQNKQNTTTKKEKKKSVFAASLKKGNNVTNIMGNQHVPLTADAWSAFEITFYTNAVTLIMCLIFFGCLQKKCSHIYKPRWTHGVAAHMVPPVVGWCSWVRHSLSITNDHIFRHSGLDALSLMMVVELGLQLFVVFMVLNVTILLFAFRRWSMNTICFGSPKLWGHWLLAVSMVFALMWLIHHHWYVFLFLFLLFCFYLFLLTPSPPFLTSLSHFSFSLLFSLSFYS